MKNVNLISANDLVQGTIVYLTESSQWDRSITSARKIEDHETATAVLTDIELTQQSVVSPYIVNATLSPEGNPMPTHFRDQFRESGPTIQFQG